MRYYMLNKILGCLRDAIGASLDAMALVSPSKPYMNLSIFELHCLCHKSFSLSCYQLLLDGKRIVIYFIRRLFWISFMSIFVPTVPLFTSGFFFLLIHAAAFFCSYLISPLSWKRENIHQWWKYNVILWLSLFW